MHTPGIRLIRFLLWVGSFLLVASLTATLVAPDRPGVPGRYLSDQVIRNAAQVEPRVTFLGEQRVGAYRDLAACWELELVPRRTLEAPAATSTATVPEKNLEDVLCVLLVCRTGAGEGRASLRYLEEPLANPPRSERHTARESAALVAPGDPLRPPYDGEPCHGRVARITADGVVFLWRGEELLLRARRLEPAEVTPAAGIEGAPAGKNR